MLARRLRPFALPVLLLPAAPLGAAVPTPVSGYRIVAKYPHLTSSYTEGFFYKDGLFFEGTGLEGHSQVLIVDPATGSPVHHADIPPQYFGEGIVDAEPNLLEWTWQTHTGFVIDRQSMRTVGTFHYTGEGWGMTRTKTELITSDGSSTLRFRDPKDFRETRAMVVTEDGRPIDQLNELEYVKGEIYANVWHSDRIARISPMDGHVLGWIDCTGLLPERERLNGEAVLNGIAYDAERDRLFVTGKQWPWVFQIKLTPRPSPALR